MCTLSYIPLSDGFFVANNRDESPLRARAIAPENIQYKGVSLLLPVDAAAKGTWLGVSNRGRFVCLMNGAFKPHVKKPYYRKSRGVVALDVLTAEQSSPFFEQELLDEIEPFTLISIDHAGFFVFRWDGERKYTESIDPTIPHQWSSATLYAEDVVKQRQTFFLHQFPVFKEDPGRLLAWHKGELDILPSLLLNTPTTQTLSVTSLYCHDNMYTMIYEDLLAQTTSQKNIKIHENPIHSIVAF